MANLPEGSTGAAREFAAAAAALVRERCCPIGRSMGLVLYNCRGCHGTIACDEGLDPWLDA